MPEEKELIAYCGLYCGDCFGYNGIIADLADKLREELDRSKFEKTAEYVSRTPFFKVFKDYPKCYKVLGGLVKFRCKKACRGGGGPPCKIRKCCRTKKIEGCWECEEFEICQKLDFLKPNHENAHLKNLRILQESGVDSFISGKKYW